MTDRTPCKHCGKIGFVRHEHFIDHGRSGTLFYCGSCNQRWQLLDAAVAPNDVPSVIDDRRVSTTDRRRSTRSDRREK